jgi:hypothetical protein
MNFHELNFFKFISSTKKGRLGLIIDLTNTDRFYDAETEVKKQGIKYYKMNCRG